MQSDGVVDLLPAVGYHGTTERARHILNCLPLLRLIDPQTSVLPLPPVKSLLCNAKPSYNVGRGLPLSQPTISPAEPPDDLPRCEFLPW